MSVKRKRQTSALRTIWINNNPVSFYANSDYPNTSWLTGNLKGFGDTFVVVNNKPLYEKLLSQRIIKTKKSTVKRCQCLTCRDNLRNTVQSGFVREFSYKTQYQNSSGQTYR